MTDRPEVLFVCVHNAGRSQMLAGLLDHHGQGRDWTCGWGALERLCTRGPMHDPTRDSRTRL